MDSNINSTTHTDNEVRPVEFKAGEVVLPMGFMVRDELGTRFHPNVVALMAVAVPLTVVASMFVRTAGRSLPRIIRALKRR